MSEYIYTATVIAVHNDDAQKKAVANVLAGMVEVDPTVTQYSEDNWKKLLDAEGNIIAWGIAFYARQGFKDVTDAFNAEPPTYPNIGADDATIDFARTFISVTSSVRNGNDKDAVFQDSVSTLGLTIQENLPNV